MASPVEPASLPPEPAFSFQDFREELARVALRQQRCLQRSQEECSSASGKPQPGLAFRFSCLALAFC